MTDQNVEVKAEVISNLDAEVISNLDAKVISNLDAEVVVPKVVRNVDAEVKTEVKAPEKEMLPKLFIDAKEKIKVEVDVLFDKSTGKITRATKSGFIDKSKLSLIGCETIWMEFSCPNYDQVTRYKSESSVINFATGRKEFDIYRFRELILSWHLKGWNLKNEKGEEIKLKLNENNPDAIHDEMLEIIKRMSSYTMGVIFTVLENELDIYLGDVRS